MFRGGEPSEYGRVLRNNSMGRKLILLCSVLPFFLGSFLIMSAYSVDKQADISQQIPEKNDRSGHAGRSYPVEGKLENEASPASGETLLEKQQQERDFLSEVIGQKERELRGKNTIIYFLLVVVFLALSGIVFTVLYTRKRQKTFYAEQAEKITLLRMQNLRNRMSPHFFFNSLSLLSTAINDPDRVRINLNHFSVLLRKSVENIDRTAISIEDELDMVKAYAGLQAQTIRGSFNFDIQIDEDINLQRKILAMMIHIPVENAIKHGLMPLKGDKKLQISIIREMQDLVVFVRDNGVGFTASGGRSSGTGTGLNTLLQIIDLFNRRNKDKIGFTIKENKGDDQESRGVIVRIAVPETYSFS